MSTTTSVLPSPSPLSPTLEAWAPRDKNALDTEAFYRLSRYTNLRPTAEGLLAESLLSGRTLALSNASRTRLVLAFLEGVRPQDLLASLDADKRPAVLRFLEHCHELRLLTRLDGDGRADDESDSLRHWEPHDLLFHVHSRRGRNPTPVGATYHLQDVVANEPAVKTDPPTQLIPLERPDMAEIERDDPTFTRVLERRRSLYSVEALDLRTLGELLHRTCRVTGTQEARGGELFLRKPYPSGGSLHSLEVYVVAERCEGLERGVYHYRPLEHELARVSGRTPEVEQLLDEARYGTAGKLPDLPSVLLVFTTRFRRVSRKYQSLAYSAVLKEVGGLFQTMYLAATAMGLAPCAIGAGDSDRFARIAGMDYYQETSVGEFILGGRPHACDP